MEPNKPTILASTELAGTNVQKMIGDSGTDNIAGYINSEEYNTKLRDPKFALHIYDVMRKSEPSVEAALELIKQPIKNADRDVVAPADDPNADLKKAFFKREMYERNIDFDQLAEEGMTMLDFGHSLAEFALELVEFEGQMLWGIKDIEFRKQTSIERWELDGGKPGVVQVLNTSVDGKPTTRQIPWSKLLVWTYKREGKNYLGTSQLRYAYKDWDMKDKIGLLQMVGLEKGAVPSPILKVPPKADAEMERQAIASVQQYRSHHKGYIKVPVGWEVDKFDLSGQTLKEILPTLTYKDRQIFMTILAPFMALGASDASGSRAVGDVQYKPYIQKISSVNRRFQAPLNGLIKFISDLNWADNSKGYCTLSNGRFQDDDISQLANACKALSDAGMLTATFETEQHFRKQMHLPAVDKDVEEYYKLKHEQRMNPPAPAPNPADPTNPEPSPKPAPKDPKKLPTKAAVLADAHRSQRQLIDVILHSPVTLTCGSCDTEQSANNDTCVNCGHDVS